MSIENQAPAKRAKATYTKEQREEAYRLFASGLSLPTVSEKLGITVYTVRNWSMRFHWRNRMLTEAAKAGLVPIDRASGVTSTKETESLSLAEAQGKYEETMQAQALRIAQIIKETPDAQLFAGADRIKKLDETARKALKLESDKPRTMVNIALLSHGTVERAKVVRELSVVTALTIEEHTGLNPAESRVDEADEASPAAPIAQVDG